MADVSAPLKLYQVIKSLMLMYDYEYIRVYSVSRVSCLLSLYALIYL